MAAPRGQLPIGIGVVLLAIGLGVGAAAIPSAAGYAGVGPNFLPWLVAVALLLCGGALIRQASSGGFRDLDAPSGASHGDWRSFAWVCAAVLLNAALITRIGFVFACALGFVLAVRGLRRSAGRTPGGPRQSLLDALAGLSIAAPVYWAFGKLLGINLPGLTGSGWL